MRPVVLRQHQQRRASMSAATYNNTSLFAGGDRKFTTEHHHRLRRRHPAGDSFVYGDVESDMVPLVTSHRLDDDFDEELLISGGSGQIFNFDRDSFSGGNAATNNNVTVVSKFESISAV